MARVRSDASIADVVRFEGVGLRLPRKRRRGGSGKTQKLRRFAGETKRDEVTILEDITFSLAPGQSLGILSRRDVEQEGVLRLAAGTLLPDAGSVVRSTTIVPMIKVAAALGPGFTIRQNIFIVGGLLGLTIDEVKEALPSIAVFAGVDQILDKYLSAAPAGTRHRLAWAISTAVPARAFAIHHALVVGERAFRQQCWTRMDLLREDGVSFLITSDSLKQFRRFCDRALVLDGGQVVLDSTVREAVTEYRAMRKPGERPVAPTQESDED